MKKADGPVEEGRAKHIGPVHPEYVAVEDRFQLLHAVGGAVEDKDARREAENIEDADKGFDIDKSRYGAGEGEEEGAKHGKGKGIEVLIMGLMAQVAGAGDTEAYELGEREIDKDDPPFEHVNAEVGVDENEADAREEGINEELEGFHGSPRQVNEATTRSMRLNQSFASGTDPTSWGTTLTLTPVFPERKSGAVLGK